MSREKETIVKKFLKLQERFLKQEEKLEDCNNELGFWTNSLEELSDIEKAFEAPKLHGKTILDIGTDCVKPLYIALKYEPDRIIGINEDLSYSYAADLEQNSKLFIKTDLKFRTCSFFNDVKLDEILIREKQRTSDFVLVSKTLHHLRTGDCIMKERDPDSNHDCREDEKFCINRFNEGEIFNRLLELGKRVIIYEYFHPSEEDDDKIRGRGGYFTINEWKQILEHLIKNYKVELVQPLQCSINEEYDNIKWKLRQVDDICFYVEKIK